MRFEKWQALGNDYLIVEARDAARSSSTPERVRRLCDPPLRRRRRRRARARRRPTSPGFVARLRIFNPDGSEAELSGNGAREAILYLRRRGWTDADTFSIQTAAGEIRPTITGETTCRVDMGRASCARRTSRTARPTARHGRPAHGASSTSRSATRSARSASRRDELEELDLDGDRPADRARTRCSPTAPTRRSGPSSART